MKMYKAAVKKMGWKWRMRQGFRISPLQLLVLEHLHECKRLESPAQEMPQIHRACLNALVDKGWIFESHAKFDPVVKYCITSKGEEIVELFGDDTNPNQVYDDDTLREIIRLCDGRTYTEVAEIIGCHPSYVGKVMRGWIPRAKQLLDEAGRKAKKRHPHRYPDSVRRQAIQMRKDGAGYVEICDTLNIAQGTLCRWIKQAGLPVEGRLSDEERLNIVRMVRRGCSRAEVADAIGRSIRVVRDAMKAYRHGQIVLPEEQVQGDRR